MYNVISGGVYSSLLVKSMIRKQELPLPREGEDRAVKARERSAFLMDCSGSIGSRVVQILDQAITQVSAGDMEFSVRNLFYATREIHSKQWPNCKFYKTYDGFAQDFLRSYEKQHGKIPGLTRMARGKVASPNEWGGTSESDIKPGMYFQSGCSNKVLIVEKAGLYEVMKANKFDVRLDVTLAYTQGFTTEAGRDMLIVAQNRGLDIVVLHDYDIAGILIYETLTKPTKRLQTFLRREGLYDLGLNWEVIQEIRTRREMTPESVTLNKAHTTALSNLLDAGTISLEEYELLQTGRIELNQLTPLELLEWLERRLDDLGLWKTIPEQCDLDVTLQEYLEEKVDTKADRNADSLSSLMLEKLEMRDIFIKLGELSSALKRAAMTEVEKVIEELEYPTMKVEDLEKSLRDDPTRFWLRAMETDAADMVTDLKDEVDFSEPSDDLVKILTDDEGVQEQFNAVMEMMEELVKEYKANTS